MKKALNIFIYAGLLWGCISSCNSDKLVIACTDQLMPEYLNFKIVDKTTNADLFFASQPAYRTDQLTITYKKTNRPVEVKTDATAGKYFKVMVPIAFQKADTLYLKVAGTDVQPLIYTSIKVEDPCPRYPVNSVNYNNSAYANVGTQVITLKQ